MLYMRFSVFMIIFRGTGKNKNLTTDLTNHTDKDEEDFEQKVCVVRGKFFLPFSCYKVLAATVESGLGRFDLRLLFKVLIKIGHRLDDIGR
jgi:hypothetical protein